MTDTNIARLFKLLKDGPLTYREAARALDLPLRAVYRAAEAGEVGHLMLRSNSLPDRYRHDDLVAAIRAVAERAGSTSSVAYRANRTPDEPSLSTIFGRFGSWDAALEAAGMPARHDPRGAKYTKYSAEGLAEAVADSGASTLREYTRWREDNPDAPSPDTVLGRLGGWNNARRAAAARSRS